MEIHRMLNNLTLASPRFTVYVVFNETTFSVKVPVLKWERGTRKMLFFFPQFFLCLNSLSQISSPYQEDPSSYELKET